MSRIDFKDYNSNFIYYRNENSSVITKNALPLRRYHFNAIAFTGNCCFSDKYATISTIFGSDILNAVISSANSKLAFKRISVNHTRNRKFSVNHKIHTVRVPNTINFNIVLQKINNFGKEKSILMRFVCKQSLSVAKCFNLHATIEHDFCLKLSEKRMLLQQNYFSAIIQTNMDEKSLSSFFKPMDFAHKFNSHFNTNASTTTNAISNCNQTSHSTQSVNRMTSVEPALNKLQCDLTKVDHQQSSISSSTSMFKAQCSESFLFNNKKTENSIVIPNCTTSQSLTKFTTTIPIATIVSKHVNYCRNSKYSNPEINSNTMFESVSDDSSNTSQLKPSLLSTDIRTSNANSNNNVDEDQQPLTNISNKAKQIDLNDAPQSSILLLSGAKSVNDEYIEDLDYDKDVTKSNKKVNDMKDIQNNSDNHNDLTNIAGGSFDLNLPEPQKNSITSSALSNVISEYLQQQMQLRPNLHADIPLLNAKQMRTKTRSEEQINCPRIQTQTTSNDTKHIKSIKPLNSTLVHTTHTLSATSNLLSLQTGYSDLNFEAINSHKKFSNEPFDQRKNITSMKPQSCEHRNPQSNNQTDLPFSISTTTSPLPSSLSVATTAPSSPSMVSLVSAGNFICPDHADHKNIDCKTCEVVEIRQYNKASNHLLYSTTATGNTNNAAQLSSINDTPFSDTLTVTTSNHIQPESKDALVTNLNALNNIVGPTSNSLTIGACSDHINGRSVGSECNRCEIILNSTRVSNNAPISTRNSCKTLKCPQCNWHYKYQETLEIHMREKHPDGESACSYCLAGQQHPRLARGESYSCGYKPYRCEICNYSTTTKGNLSIHMQSDKHLNNMQEVNNSQNIVAAAVAVASNSTISEKDELACKLRLPNSRSLHHTQQQQQLLQISSTTDSNIVTMSNTSVASSTTNVSGNNCNVNSSSFNSSSIFGIKPKTPFRCEICNYETTVARNLRIHMTSEKHTHNIMIIQNSIKHLQVFNFLQQQQQQLQQQQLQHYRSDVNLTELSSNATSETFKHDAAADVTANHTPELSFEDSTSPSINHKSIHKAVEYSIDKPQNLYSCIEEQLQLPTSSKQVVDIENVSSSLIDPWPTMLFSCLVCLNFNTNNLDELHQHLSKDRSQTAISNSTNTVDLASVSTISSSLIPPTNTTDFFSLLSEVENFHNSHSKSINNNNSYICSLCNYKTNLKANFQLHNKTDKHLQKINFVNHVREGGVRNEHKIRFYEQHKLQMNTNTVFIKCNCCDFYTDSLEKLVLHTQNMNHESMLLVFKHLSYLIKQHDQRQQRFVNELRPQNLSELDADPSKLYSATLTSLPPSPSTTPLQTLISTSINEASQKYIQLNSHLKKELYCELCNYYAASTLEMLRHAKNLRHLQAEQLFCLQNYDNKRNKPNYEYIFKLKLIHKDQEKCYQQRQFHQQENGGQQQREELLQYADGYLVQIDSIDTNDDDNNHLHNLSNETKNVKQINKCFTPSKDTVYDSITLNQSDDAAGNKSSSAHMKLDELANTSELCGTNQITKIIFKCNNCDYYSPTKSEMEHHNIQLHNTSEKYEYTSIPTNPVAIQVFQAAMAAATLASISKLTSHDTEQHTPYTVSDTSKYLISETHLLESMVVNTEDFHLLESSTNTGDTSSSYEQKNNICSKFEASSLESPVSPSLHFTKEQTLQCPLCQYFFTEKKILTMHLITDHHVNSSSLMRLLQLVENSIWKTMLTNNSSTSVTLQQEIFNKKNNKDNANDYQNDNDSNDNNNGIHQEISRDTLIPLSFDELQCESCAMLFKYEQDLLEHAQKTQHYTIRDSEYFCLAANSYRGKCSYRFSTPAAMFSHYNDYHINLIISERHTYKYRCKHCSLAFRTSDKLASHMLYHTMRDATKCSICQRNFRSTQTLHKHIEQAHNTIKTDLVAVNKTATVSLTTTKTCNNSISVESNNKFNKNDQYLQYDAGAMKSNAYNVAFKQENHHDASQQASSFIKSDDNNSFSLVSNLIESNSELSPCHEQLTATMPVSTQTPTQQLKLLQNISTFNLLEFQKNLQFTNLPLFQSIQQQLQQLLQLSQISQLSQVSQEQHFTDIPQSHHINVTDILNALQMHRLLSVNFMNLAPRLECSSGLDTLRNFNSNSNKILNRNHLLQPNQDLLEQSSSLPPSFFQDQTEAIDDKLSNIHKNLDSAQSSAHVNHQLTSNQKRSRTRITDEQLKILRSHFDINNSPSEESILEMSQKSNLPMKVVKHWFRNTLFKERQRNKDSPYNFNNPPSTTLNIEEYERTGNAKVSSTASPSGTEFSTKDKNDNSPPLTKAVDDVLNESKKDDEKLREQEDMEANSSQASTVTNTSFTLDIPIKSEQEGTSSSVPNESDKIVHNQEHKQQQHPSNASPEYYLSKHQSTKYEPKQNELKLFNKHLDQTSSDNNEMLEANTALLQIQSQDHNPNISEVPLVHSNNCDTKAESISLDTHSASVASNASITSNFFANMSAVIDQQHSKSNLLSSDQNYILNNRKMGPPKKLHLQMNSTNTITERNCSGHNNVAICGSPNSNSSISSITSNSKRANRTRFTDYQIKVLQEFFENNSYPKDSDLEYLSKLLLLSPRVIVVWFQNARQKQRKIYENQPNNSPFESEEKKQNITYTCKKCNLVFQRYYELIRHQKNHCFKEENNNRSAKAQIAAAQIAQNISSEDSDSSNDINIATSNLHISSQVTGVHPPHQAVAVVVTNKSNENEFSSLLNMEIDRMVSVEDDTKSKDQKLQDKFECNQCRATLANLTKFKEHQLIHLMKSNTNLHSTFNQPQQCELNYKQETQSSAATVTFGSLGGILKGLEKFSQAQYIYNDEHKMDNSINDHPPTKKRRYSETLASLTKNSTKLANASLSSKDNDEYNFLYKYFVHHEDKTGKILEHLRSKQFEGNIKKDFNFKMEYLLNYYQQSEIKKLCDYDFLLEYYIKNKEREQQEHQAKSKDDAIEFRNDTIMEGKPSLEYLINYYHCTESKRVFQTNFNYSINSNFDERDQIHKIANYNSENALIGSTIQSNKGSFYSIPQTPKNNSSNNELLSAKNNSNSNNNGNSHDNENINNENNEENVESSTSVSTYPEKSVLNNFHLFTSYKEQIDQLDGLGEIKSNLIYNSVCDQFFLNNQLLGSSSVTQSSAIYPLLSSNLHSLQQMHYVVNIAHSNIEHNHQEKHQRQQLAKIQQTFSDQFDPITNLTLEIFDTSPNDGSKFDNISKQSKLLLDSMNSGNQTTNGNYKQNKRLRTEIHPNQLELLYDYYQKESNPSRRMLEEISQAINLKKRVVQNLYGGYPFRHELNRIIEL